MARQAITAADGLQARIFHPGNKGLRGITLLNSSGKRGACLSVAVHDERGTRKGINTLPLGGYDFYLQWERAIAQIATHYGVRPDSEIYRAMRNAAGAFLKRYDITINPIVVRVAEVAHAI